VPGTVRSAPSTDQVDNGRARRDLTSRPDDGAGRQAWQSATWTSWFDLSLSYLSHASGSYELVIRGEQEVKQPKFVAWYLEAGTPRAALIINDWDAEDPVRDVIRRGQPVEADRLADDSVPLTEL
jgi:Reductase C-terminal